MESYHDYLIRKALRKVQQNGDTVRSMAQRAEVSPSHISNFINGKASRPLEEAKLKALLGDDYEKLTQQLKIADASAEILLEHYLGVEDSTEDLHLLRRTNAVLPQLQERLAEGEEIPQTLLELIFNGNEKQIDAAKARLGDQVSMVDDPYVITAVINANQHRLDLRDLLNDDIENFDKFILLDPANPRILGSEGLPAESRLTPESLKSEKTQEQCRSLLEGDARSIYNSVRKGGYRRVNPIFAVSLTGDGAPYVVIEGNTRVTAIRTMLADPEIRRFDLFQDVEIKVLDGFSYFDSQKIRDSVMFAIHMNGTKEWKAYRQGHKLYTSYLRLQKQGYTDESRIYATIADYGRATPAKVKRDINAYRMLQESVKLIEKGDDEYELNTRGNREQVYSLFRELQGQGMENTRHFIENEEKAKRFYYWCGLYSRNVELEPEDEEGASRMELVTLTPAPISGTHAIKNFNHLLTKFQDDPKQLNELFSVMDDVEDKRKVSELCVEYDRRDGANLKEKLSRVNKIMARVQLGELLAVRNDKDIKKIAMNIDQAIQSLNTLYQHPAVQRVLNQELEDGKNTEE